MLWERRERDFRTHQAVASVATGLAVTLPDLRVAVNPGEARQTGAGIAALACVHARGPVGTGFVVRAVVQICKQMGGNLNFTAGAALTLRFPAVQRRLRTLVAEDASPAFLAGALPRLFTGTMFAGGMDSTHVTKEALPALSASVYTVNNKSFLNPLSHGYSAFAKKKTSTDIYLPSN